MSSEALSYLFVVNPASKNGKTARFIPVLRALIKESGIEGRIEITSIPGSLKSTLTNATEDVFVAVGGDGTVHDVTTSIVSSGITRKLAVLPRGTGNDFVKMIGISLDSRKAFFQILNATYRRIDLGLISWQEAGENQQGYFLNAVGVGFDAAAAAAAQRFKFLPGATLAYLAAVFDTLRNWDACTATIETESERFTGPLLLVTAGNGTCSGGKFYLTPDAVIDDGLLDVCRINDASTLRILSMLPRGFWGGHVKLKEVHMSRVPSMKLWAEKPLPIHADGEILSLSAEDIEISLQPAAIEVGFGG